MVPPFPIAILAIRADLNLRRGIVAAWLGFALAALFFYPLAAALAHNAFYLQWQPRDAIEVLVAATVLAALFGAGVYVTWPRTTRQGNAALAALAAVPLASLV